MGDGQLEKVLQVVNPWNGRADFLKERFEVFLHCLLAVKAHQVMNGWPSLGESIGAAQVGLGLADPHCRFSFHRELCLCR